MLLHTDASMGTWTALLYLNPQPPEGDGTAFYRHRATGATGSTDDAEAADWLDAEQWERIGLVEGRFNRLLLFSSGLFHARAIPENYGTDRDSARLLQICFGTGEFT